MDLELVPAADCRRRHSYGSTDAATCRIERAASVPLRPVLRQCKCCCRREILKQTVLLHKIAVKTAKLRMDIRVVVENHHATPEVKAYCLYMYYFMGVKPAQLTKMFSKSKTTITTWIDTYESTGVLGRISTESVYPSSFWQRQALATADALLDWLLAVEHVIHNESASPEDALALAPVAEIASLPPAAPAPWLLLQQPLSPMKQSQRSRHPPQSLKEIPTGNIPARRLSEQVPPQSLKSPVQSSVPKSKGPTAPARRGTTGGVQSDEGLF
ncbi:hypothetical protein BDR26DRAFT_914466 [Obelidium mucronatum]|nr:hypothetical protein BDR26DRAFT_914466 [Obelidium mucronatum]